MKHGQILNNINQTEQGKEIRGYMKGGGEHNFTLGRLRPEEKFTQTLRNKSKSANIPNLVLLVDFFWSFHQ